MAPYPKMTPRKTSGVSRFRKASRGFVPRSSGVRGSASFFPFGFRSPGGERFRGFPSLCTQEQRITFVLERTVIYVNYEVVQTTTGSQLILIRMLDPNARHLDTSGLPRLSFPSRFPRLASDYRIFHFRCDLSGTRPVHDTDDTLRHRSRSVSLHLSGIQ